MKTHQEAIELLFGICRKTPGNKISSRNAQQMKNVSEEVAVKLNGMIESTSSAQKWKECF